MKSSFSQGLFFSFNKDVTTCRCDSKAFTLLESGALHTSVLRKQGHCGPLSENDRVGLKPDCSITVTGLHHIHCPGSDRTGAGVPLLDLTRDSVRVFPDSQTDSMLISCRLVGVETLTTMFYMWPWMSSKSPERCAYSPSMNTERGLA